MLYTKGSIEGYMGDSKQKVISIDFDYLMTDETIDELLELLRGKCNNWGEALHFKMTLESEDV
jgi:hypothetical protein